MPFISFEGIDGSGKTTQAALLAAALRQAGHEVLRVREPGGTPASEAIRSVLLTPGHRLCAESELFLFLAARAQVVRSVIHPALEAGRVVVADRFTDSTLAYQGYGRGLDPEWLAQLNERATGGLQPHLTILMDIDPRIAHARTAPISLLTDPLESEGVAFQRRVREGYLEIARKQPRIRVLDGARAQEALASEIHALVEGLLVPVAS